MTSERDEVREDRDYTKLIWGGIVLLVGLMLFAIWRSGQVNPTTSVVRVKHILISFDKANPADRNRALERVQEIRKRILDGEDFGKLAEQYSNDAGSAKRGGDLGFMPRGSFVDSFEEYAWNAPVNELSDAIQTQYGFHLAIVVERRLSDVDRLKQEQSQAQSASAGGAAEETSSK